MPINKEGRAAFYRGVRAEDTPYNDTARRIQWVKGWYDSKRDHSAALDKRGQEVHLA